MARPWLDAGYTCYIVDIQHPEAYETGGITKEGNLYKVRADLTKPWLCPVDRNRIAFAFAFPPCDDIACSGARWLKGKGLRALEKSIAMFATAAELCEWFGAPYGIENPRSTISTYWRKPDHKFDPCDYTGFWLKDNYTKETWLWTGNGFVMPEPFKADGLGKPDDRIHKCRPGPDRKDIRSETPMGFSLAVFRANAGNLKLKVS